MTEDAAGNRWLASRESGRAESYDQGFEQLAATGADVHGEAAFVEGLHPSTVLNAGCGTGRVAIELARRGISAIGADIDATMLAVAQRKAPHLTWLEADLAKLDLRARFDVVVAAGNVMIFLAPGSEQAVVDSLARSLVPGGLLVAGFQLGRGLSLEDYDACCTSAGLALVERFATWDREPYEGGDYAVSVSKAPAPSPTPPPSPC